MKIEVAIFAGMIALVGGLIWLAIIATNAENEKCKQAGGRILDKSSVTTGLSTSGNVAVVPYIVRLCITPDGRILF